LNRGGPAASAAGWCCHHPAADAAGSPFARSLRGRSPVPGLRHLEVDRPRLDEFQVARIDLRVRAEQHPRPLLEHLRHLRGVGGRAGRLDLRCRGQRSLLVALPLEQRAAAALVGGERFRAVAADGDADAQAVALQIIDGGWEGDAMASYRFALAWRTRTDNSI